MHITQNFTYTVQINLEIWFTTLAQIFLCKIDAETMHREINNTLSAAQSGAHLKYAGLEQLSPDPSNQPYRRNLRRSIVK